MVRTANFAEALLMNLVVLRAEEVRRNEREELAEMICGKLVEAWNRGNK